MKTRTFALWLWVVLCLLFAIGAQGAGNPTPIYNLSHTNIAKPTNWINIVTHPGQTNGNRAIQLTDLLDNFITFPNWPSVSVTNAVGIVKSNGAVVTTAATTLDFITGSNTLALITNTAGTVSIQINSSASGSDDVNGEAAITNSTKVGLVYGKTSVTNFLRSLQGGNGIVLTNQGTNVPIAIDPSVVASQANLTASSNSVITASSNNVRVAAGTGGITVTPSGSGGVMTYTVSDDDAGGSALTFAAIANAGSGLGLVGGTQYGWTTNLSGNLLLCLTNLTTDRFYYVDVHSLGYATTISNAAAIYFRDEGQGGITSLSTNGTTTLWVWKDGVSGRTNAIHIGPAFSIRPDGNSIQFITNLLTKSITVTNTGASASVGGSTNGSNLGATVTNFNFIASGNTTITGAVANGIANIGIAASSSTVNATLDSLTVTNPVRFLTETVQASSDRVAIIDFNKGNNFHLILVTNTLCVFSNIADGVSMVPIEITQNSNANWSVTFTNHSGLVRTNGPYTATTNAGASDWLVVKASMGTNVMLSVDLIGGTNLTTLASGSMTVGGLVVTNTLYFGPSSEFSAFSSGGFFQLYNPVSGGSSLSIDEATDAIVLGSAGFTPKVTVPTLLISESNNIRGHLNANSAYVTNSLQVQGTNFVGTLALPNVATNKVLMTGGGSNAVAATLASSFAMYNGTLGLAAGVLSNMFQTGFGQPYFNLTTNNSAVGNTTNFNVATGNSLIVSNDNTGISTLHLGSALVNLTGTAARNVTNFVSLSTSNATSKPLTNSYTSGVLTMFGLEAGANVTITPNASNLVIASTGGTASTNFIVTSHGSGHITNFLQFAVLNLGDTTNATIPWTTTNAVQWYPSNNAAVALSGTAGAGTNRQVIELAVVLTNTSITSIVLPASGRNGRTPVILSAPSTNAFQIVYDGFRTYIESIQELTTGSGATMLSNAPSVVDLTLPTLPTNAFLRVGAGGIMTTGIVGTGLSMSAGGTLSATAGSSDPPEFTKRVYRYAVQSGTTFSQFGSAFGASGSSTAIAATDTGPHMIRYYTGASAGNEASWYENAESFYTNKNWTMVFRCGLTNSGNMSFQVGACGATLGGTEDPLATLRPKVCFVGTTNDANYYFLTSTGSATTRTSTGIALDTSLHTFRIVYTPTSVTAYIDDVLKATHTTNIPTTTLMRYFINICTREALAKGMNIVQLYCEEVF